MERQGEPASPLWWWYSGSAYPEHTLMASGNRRRQEGTPQSGLSSASHEGCPQKNITLRERGCPGLLPHRHGFNPGLLLPRYVSRIIVAIPRVCWQARCRPSGGPLALSPLPDIHSVFQHTPTPVFHSHRGPPSQLHSLSGKECTAPQPQSPRAPAKKVGHVKP